MTTTVSKGRLFRVTVEVSDERLKALKAAPEAAEKALTAAADYWHTGILPKHFEKGAAGVYGYADRSRTYLRNWQKRGKPSLVFSGSLRRDLRSKASFQKVGKTVNLKMSARVLNFVPNMPENSADRYIKHKNGRGYPNLKREIKAMTDADLDLVEGVVARELEHLFAPSAGESSAATLAPSPSPAS